MNNDKFCGEVLWFDPKRGYGFIGWDVNGEKQKDFIFLIYLVMVLKFFIKIKK